MLNRIYSIHSKGHSAKHKKSPKSSRKKSRINRDLYKKSTKSSRSSRSSKSSRSSSQLKPAGRGRKWLRELSEFKKSMNSIMDNLSSFDLTPSANKTLDRITDSMNSLSMNSLKFYSFDNNDYKKILRMYIPLIDIMLKISKNCKHCKHCKHCNKNSMKSVINKLNSLKQKYNNRKYSMDIHGIEYTREHVAFQEVIDKAFEENIMFIGSDRRPHLNLDVIQFPGYDSDDRENLKLFILIWDQLKNNGSFMIDEIIGRFRQPDLTDHQILENVRDTMDYLMFKYLDHIRQNYIVDVPSTNITESNIVDVPSLNVTESNIVDVPQVDEEDSMYDSEDQEEDSMYDSEDPEEEQEASVWQSETLPEEAEGDVWGSSSVQPTSEWGSTTEWAEF